VQNLTVADPAALLVRIGHTNNPLCAVQVYFAVSRQEVKGDIYFPSVDGFRVKPGMIVYSNILLCGIWKRFLNTSSK
jgi:hypothetical protein